MKFCPYKKGWGAENVLSMLKGGGGTKRFGVVFMQQLEVLAILEGGRTKFPLSKTGAAKMFTLS